MSQVSEKTRAIFISHRHEDSQIADVLREFVKECTWGSVKVYQSSFPENAPRTARVLTQELRSQLHDADVVFCVYTCANDDWSYCMWECGVATDPLSDDPRVVVIQFSDDCPSPYSEQVRVNAKDRPSVGAFVRDFLTDPGFFPGFGEALLPRLQPSDAQIMRKADELFDALQPFIPKEGGAEEWPAWAFLRVQLPLRDVEKWKTEPDAGARLEAARTSLLTDAVIMNGDLTARNLFGRAKFPSGMRFTDVVDDWQAKYPGASLKWVDSLARQVMRAGSWQFPEPDWIAMRGASHGDTEWCIPVLNWIRRLPQSESIQFDIYFIPVRRDDRTGQPHLEFATADLATMPEAS